MERVQWYQHVRRRRHAEERAPFCIPTIRVLENHVFLDPKSADRLQLVMFWTGDAELRAPSSSASPNNFFIGATSWSHIMNLRKLLACDSEQYFTFPASTVWSETTHILVIKATLTRMPRKMRLSQRLASYLWELFKHFFKSHDKSETTSGMQFVATFFISSLRLTIQNILLC